MRTIHGTTWSVEDAQAYIKARVKVDETGCWIWQRTVSDTGYGSHGIPRTKLVRSAHRTSYEAFAGSIGVGLFVCHTCDVRRCVN